MKPFRNFALAALGLLALSGATTAAAQSSSGSDQTCLVGGQRGQGVAQIATGCPIGRTPLLSSFRFGFFNGGHRFRQATLMPNGESFEASWADSNGDDPFFIEARWLRAPEASGGVVTAVVQGIADIPIPAGPPNTSLVLSGFEFKRADGSEANIRTIAVALDGPRRTVRTVLLDDQNVDFTNIATAIAVGFAVGATGVPDPMMSVGATGATSALLNMGGQRLTAGRPLYEAIGPENGTLARTPVVVAPPSGQAGVRVQQPSGQSQQAPIGALGGSVNAGQLAAQQQAQALRNQQAEREAAGVKVSDTNARAYRVRIAYAWVPNTRLVATRMVSGSGRTATDASGRLPRNGRIVLHGFSFHFGNSDHFIQDFGVHLAGAPVQMAVPRNEIVSWQDDGRDDPIQWTVRFSEFAGQ